MRRSGAAWSCPGTGRGVVVVQKRKLIEVALPLEAINRESAREKSIRHGHPSTLHLWWARRPLAAARAVLFAQLVDDPSSRPERVPDRGGSARRARAPARHHRAARRVGEHTRRAAARRGARGDPEVDRRQPAADPRPVRRRRHDPARGPAPRSGGARLRPQPGRRAHQQGADRDPAEVRGPAARCSPASPTPRSAAGRAPRASPPTSAPTASGCATRRRGASATSTHRRRSPTARGDRHRLDLGADRHLPEPRLRHRDAARALLVARQEEGQGGVRRPDRRGRPDAPERQAGRVRDRSRLAGAPTRTTTGRSGGPAHVCVACGRRCHSTTFAPKAGPAARRSSSWRSSPRATGGASTSPPTREHDCSALRSSPPDRPDGEHPAQTLEASRRPTYGLTEWADLFTNRQLLALTTFSDLVA